MKLKPGVLLGELTPQMVMGALIVKSVYQKLDPGCSCTVTSANDSKHSDKSLHYTGNALDFRTHDFTANKLYLVQEVKGSLGIHFDVVLEGVGTPNEHLHVEYQPKGNS